MTNLVERDVEEYQQVRGQRGLLDRASIDIGRLVSVLEEAPHYVLTVRSVLRDLLHRFRTEPEHVLRDIQPTKEIG